MLAALAVLAPVASGAPAPPDVLVRSLAARTFTAAGDRAGDAIAVARTLSPPTRLVLIERTRGGAWRRIWDVPHGPPRALGGDRGRGRRRRGDRLARGTARHDEALAATVRTPGSGFSDAQTVAAAEAHGVRNPAVAVAWDGHAIVAYQTDTHAVHLNQRGRIALSVAPPGGQFVP